MAASFPKILGVSGAALVVVMLCTVPTTKIYSPGQQSYFLTSNQMKVMLSENQTANQREAKPSVVQTSNQNEDVTSPLTSQPATDTSSTLEHPATVPVLLFTYYRGGSSFLGETFNNNPDAFYWFEPLHWLSHHVALQGPNVYDRLYEVTKKGTVRPQPDFKVKIFRDTLLCTLTCDVMNLTKWVWQDYFVRSGSYSFSTEAFSYCMEKNEDHRICLPYLRDQCLEKTIRAVKTIRSGMYMVPFLLERIPKLKVVFYTRDPRGVMNSRQELRHYKPEEFSEKAREHCQRQEADYVIYRQLETQSPDRLMHVTYESLAESPSSRAKEIYKFLGFPTLPPDVEKWIRTKTVVSGSEYSPYGTERDSDVTATKWMTSMSRGYQSRVIKVCGNVLSLLNYTYSESRTKQR